MKNERFMRNNISKERKKENNEKKEKESWNEINRKEMCKLLPLLKGR